MNSKKHKTGLCALGVALTMFVGCSKTVMVPPRIDLQEYGTIGMVTFSSNAEGNLEEYASQKFVETLQSSQSGIRILELGEEERVLQSIEREKFDPEAIREIGEAFDVDAVIIGRIEVTDVKRKVGVSTILRSMSAQADVEAFLTARLLDAISGATIWTSSARGKETVAELGLTSKGPVFFGASDPENAYGKLINGLVYRATHDFRVQYVRQ